MCFSTKIFWKVKREGISKQRISKLTNFFYYLTIGTLILVLILSQFTNYSLAFTPGSSTEEITLSLSYFVLSLLNIVILFLFIIFSVILRSSQLTNEIENKFQLKNNKETFLFLFFAIILLLCFFGISYFLLFIVPVFSIIYYALVVHLINVVNNFNENLIIYNDALEEAFSSSSSSSSHPSSSSSSRYDSYSDDS